jgi:hypothetical protein
MDIRTHIATELLKGILSYNPITYGVKMNVSSAVLHTDLLLKELAKTKP